ncbi:Structural maintenance of chromosomes protein 4 [Microsporum canis]|uniref:Structural maintenance of chromosomes protein n=1 Tax=Arthroderma otae (strain ATCC MYA-4605 / CBS 113480) TaxID=554155 RepID=C5G063_ARTOC|nr:structural maintenance of chromosomes protein 4 [Microsporum canis CBS 113480]EEQ35516.1 structural maintenance of chromosomes protein 4 [Microsporum canis CBS 113480]
MASRSSRPRRSVSRKSFVIEESSEDEPASGRVTPSIPSNDDEEDDEEDYTPVPKRRVSRRVSKPPVEEPTTPTPATRRSSRRHSRMSGRESTISTTEESVLSVEEEPELPSRRTSKARQSVPRSQSSRQSSIEVSSLPTPAQSQSPETDRAQPRRPSGTPLADITENAVNQTPSDAPDIEKSVIDRIDPTTSVLERPMDIMLKSRSAPQVAEEEPSGPKQRMVITHLVLTNFKSYAGQQFVGPFHASFSSVVGPNGSGKSNVIDSLLFVFGFRASKMRQGKISALIHNSANFPNLPFCEVEVHFQEIIDLPDGGHEVVPGSQLVVSRRAFRNNTSKYYMNKKEANFTTVTEFLKGRGIDLDHKRFLILQGEVESIAQMKAKAANEHDDGLLEYLEDIIGTSKYKTPIDEAAAEVEVLNETCNEKNNRVQHVEKEKASLEDKKNKALAYIKDENELVEKQSALYQIYIDECNDNTNVTQEAILQNQELLNLELEKHQGNEDEIKQLQRAYKKTAKEYEVMEKETQGIMKEMAKYDKESVKLEEKRKFLNTKLKKLEKTMNASRLAASECASLVERHNDDFEKKSAEIAALEKEMKEEEKELAAIRESLKGKTQGLSEQIAAKQTSLEPWKEKINEKQSAAAVAQSELDILREKSNAGAVALEEAQAKIVSIKEEMAAKASELEQCRAEKTNLEHEVAACEANVKKFAEKEPEYRSRLSHLRQKADEARASLSSTQTQGNVLSGLMRLKESGRIEGFHGRLGNLGTIDEKYDVAISTACPALDNLVVDTVEVGQQCIDYLRKNNLGRANFILLDRLPRRDMSSVFTPDSVPRLFDLVKPADEKFKAAFYSVLQNTLVAKDLQQANKIAYGARRWRVVTLDGQLIDVSGTMSGGGTRVARGGMSSKPVAEVSREQVAKLDADRDAMEKKFQAFQERQRELESELKTTKDSIPKVETAIQKLQLEIDSSKRNLVDTQRRVKELSEEHKPSSTDEKREASLEKTIMALEKEVENLRSEMAGVEEEIQTLQDKIMEVGGVRLRGQKAKVDGLKEQVLLLTEEVSNAEVSKSKNEKLHIKHEKSRADAESELEHVREDIERLDEEARSQAKAVSGIKQKTEEAEEALQTKQEELTALKSELDEKTAELNETRAVEIEMRNKLEESQKALLENEKRAKYWHDKFSKLSLQNISDLGEEEAVDNLQIYSKDELAEMNKESLKAMIAALEEKTQNTSVDLSVLGEYRRRVAEHETRSADLAAALASRDAAKSRLDTLRSLRLTGFMEGFSTISLRLKEMYQMITMGGNAELELVDSLDPFSEGILFSVMPPKKSWKNISNLSGGEKTLSSLALVFALHHYRPTPLYVMDEIDAALDFRNVSIVASYIKERTKNAQFIVISLRNNMFELASRLVGVYKVNHMTKSVTIENRDYIEGRN